MVSQEVVRDAVSALAVYVPVEAAASQFVRCRGRQTSEYEKMIDSEIIMSRIIAERHHRLNGASCPIASTCRYHALLELRSPAQRQHPPVVSPSAQTSPAAKPSMTKTVLPARVVSGAKPVESPLRWAHKNIKRAERYGVGGERSAFTSRVSEQAAMRRGRTTPPRRPATGKMADDPVIPASAPGRQ